MSCDINVHSRGMRRKRQTTNCLSTMCPSMFNHLTVVIAKTAAIVMTLFEEPIIAFTVMACLSVMADIKIAVTAVAFTL